jgi:hypothetical protein
MIWNWFKKDASVSGGKKPPVKSENSQAAAAVALQKFFEKR